jgi:SNF family Na+-dependent transporter
VTDSSSPGSPARPSRPPQEAWGSRLGIILAVSGSAVGLGNFLRFPGTAAENGGGAFMIPYFAALLLLGIPIGWAEWTMGRYAGRKGFHSCPAVMGVVGRGRVARYLGVLGLLIPVCVYMYYGLIEAWTLQYAWAFATGGIGLDSAADKVAHANGFFDSVSGEAGNGSLYDQGRPFFFWLAVMALNTWFVARGLSKGIEKFCSYAMPAMAVCAVVVLVRVLTLGTPDPSRPELSVETGLGYMWNPDFAALSRADTWLAAAGQIFFSLSVGFGVIVNYASYLKKKDDVVLSGLTASATNEVFEVGFGGMITLTAAFVFLGAAGATGGAFALGFKTLPIVFHHMGAFGNFIGALWFFMLFLAAITSSLSMLQPVKSFVQESVGLSHRGAVTLVVGMGGLGSLWVMWASGDGVARHVIDFWVGTAMIFVLAAVQIVCFAWVFGVDRGLAEAHEGAKMRIPRVMRYVMKYIAPGYLLIVFVAFCFQSLGDHLDALLASPIAKATIAIVLFVALMLCMMVRIGEKRWRAQGLDLDGTRPADDDLEEAAR